MACNCGTKEEIDRIYNWYSKRNGTPDEGENKLLFYIKRCFYFILNLIGYVVVFPIMFIYVIFKFFWYESPVIDINKLDLLRIKNNLTKKNG